MWYPDELTIEELNRVESRAKDYSVMASLGHYFVNFLQISLGFFGFNWILAVGSVSVLGVLFRLLRVFSKRVCSVVNAQLRRCNPAGASAFGEIVDDIDGEGEVERLKVNFAPARDVRVLLFSYVVVLVYMSLWHSLGRIIAFVFERV